MAENIEKTHESLINDSLATNATRMLSTKQVIEQYENQIMLFKELPATLKKSVLVPIGSKGFLRGQIVHTNEVYHNVGSGYVIKRTAKQAIDFCERMLRETNTFLSQLQKEEKWLTNQLKITAFDNPFASKDCVDIVEQLDEHAVAEWRLRHRENVKKWKQEEAKEREKIQRETSDKDIFSRLDELEILEELEQFTLNINKNLEFQECGVSKSTNAVEVFGKVENVHLDKENKDGPEHTVVDCKQVNEYLGNGNTSTGQADEAENGTLGKQIKEKENTKSLGCSGIVEKIVNEHLGNENTNIESTKRADGKGQVGETENDRLEKQIKDKENTKSLECAKMVETIENKQIENENSKKYLDFVELHKLNENLENLHNTSTNAENKNDLDLKAKKLQIEEELEKSRKAKTIIRNDEDLMKRLDELEKEENLLEELEILTSTEQSDVAVTPHLPRLPPPPADVPADDSKKCTIRFNEQVRTNFYVSSTAVSDDSEIEIKTPPDTKTETGSEEESVTLFIHFSHSDGTVNKTVEETAKDADTVSEFGLLTPSDIYDLPYRPKSILKNKNRLFEEPQHTGEPLPEPLFYHHRKRDRGRDRWVCQDTFSSKNGNDSDQENANVVQVPPPLTEVKEKTDFSNTGVAASAIATSPPKKRQSRFLVSRALITKK